MSTPRFLHRRLLDGSEHGPGLDVLLGAIFSGLARTFRPSPGQIIETGKTRLIFTGIDTARAQRSGPVIDFKCPELWNLFNSGIDLG